MFNLTAIAAAAAALALGGTGTAALVMNSPPCHSDNGAEITAKAEADLLAAEQAHQRAVTLLSQTGTEGKAEAEAQIALAGARLEEASTSMKAAVDTGSKAAVNAFSDFTARSVRLVGSLASTASASANASVKARADIVTAVDTQITTAKGVVATTGRGVLNTLTQVRAELPATITGSVKGGGHTTVSPAVPAARGAVSSDASLSASGSANASTTPASAGVVGSATGTVSALLGTK